MQTAQELKLSIQERFSAVATSPNEEKKFPVGLESAKKLGYDIAELEALPDCVTDSFCGVGNPFTLQAVERGQTVLDLGCGAGLDCILASRRVGPYGKVIGIDMTEAMVDKARHNIAVCKLKNVDIVAGVIEDIPLEDASVDVAISNGVFNLCFDKPKVLSEVFRVIKPSGRLQMADILLHDNVSAEEVQSKGAWSD